MGEHAGPGARHCRGKRHIALTKKAGTFAFVPGRDCALCGYTRTTVRGFVDTRGNVRAATGAFAFCHRPGAVGSGSCTFAGLRWQPLQRVRESGFWVQATAFDLGKLNNAVSFQTLNSNFMNICNVKHLIFSSPSIYLSGIP